MSANTSPSVTIDLKPPPPDFILALADVIRFIDKRRACAATLTTDEPKTERPPAPPKKQR